MGTGSVAERCDQRVCARPSRAAAWMETNHSYRQYVEITHDYPLAAAQAFSTLHPSSPFTFVYVSGEGATQSPGMLTPIYGRVKGQTESALLELGKQNPMIKLYNVRPGGVDWTDHPEIHPYMSQQALYKKMMLSVLNTVYKPLMTPTRPMGKIMTELAMSKGQPMAEGSGIGMNGRLVSNAAIRRLAGL